jgi:hypothetical protein
MNNNWISIEEKLPPFGMNVECLNWDDEIFIDCVTDRCTGRPTDYGYTPTSRGLPEGVTHWRSIK